MAETGIDIPEMVRGLIQHLPNTSAILFGLDSRFLFAEGPLVRQMLPRVGSLVGKSPVEVLSPDLIDIFMPLQQRVLAGESFNFEQVLPIGTYHAYADPLRDEAGNLIGGMILAHDVTQVRRGESALRASESLFHSLVNLVPVGIIQTNGSGDRIFCNTAWCEMTGVSLEEALRDVNYGIIHPDDLAVARRAWDTMMETGSPFTNVVFRYLRPDGSSVWVSGNGAPLYDEQGTVTGYLGSVTNITEQVLAQAALRESEARYRSVVNTMSEGVILQGRDGKVQAINPAAERIIGLPAEMLLEHNDQQPTWPLIHEDGTPFLADTLPLAVTLRTGEPQTNVIIGMHTPDRALRWVSTSSRPLLADNETLPYAALVTMNDVTDLHEALARLQQERDLLRTVIDNTPEQIFLKGMDGRFLICNDAYARTVGKSSPEELVGKTAFDFWPPDTAAGYHAEDQAIFASGQPFTDDQRRYAAVGGEPEFVIATKIPLRDANGQITGLLGIIRDITERKRMENAIRQSEERLRIITDNIQDIVMQQDPAGMTVFASESCRTQLGYEPQFLLGRDSMELIHPDDRARVSADGRGARQNGAQLIMLEARALHRDGHYIRLESLIKFLFDEQANYIGAVSISRDITERNRLQELTLEREKLQARLEKELELGTLKTRMMQRIAHEFRTPLAIIQSSVDTLTLYLDRLTPDQRSAKADMISGQIASITAMLDQIGLVLHGSFKPAALHRHEVDVSALCRQVASEVEAQLNRPGKFELDLTEPMLISADEQVLKTALARVMRNAVRFSEPTPVSVRLRRAGSGIEVKVADRGIGILPDEQARIFEPFFRGSNTSEIGGLGVGLTLARAAIEAHNGTITIESVPAQGTTVTLWIPAAAPEALIEGARQ